MAQHHTIRDLDLSPSENTRAILIQCSLDLEDILHPTPERDQRCCKRNVGKCPKSSILTDHTHVHPKLDTARNSEVRDHMNKKMLDLARISRDDYVAKMQYQRLRMQELEMM